MASSIDTSALGESKKYRIVRDDDRDLLFRGWMLGEGASGSGGNSGYRCDWNRGVNVKIYFTTGGNFAASWKHWSQWQGESDSWRAEIYKSPEVLLAGLRGEDGILRPAEKEAWEEACEKIPTLAAIECEEVE